MNKEELNKCGCGCEEENTSCGCGENDEACGCGCGSEDHDHEHESFVVDLEDENGNIIPCDVIDGFEYKDTNYILVQNPNDGSMYLFKAEGEDGELVIPDDEEFEEVSAYYESLLEEEEEEEEE